MRVCRGWCNSRANKLLNRIWPLNLFGACRGRLWNGSGSWRGFWGTSVHGVFAKCVPVLREWEKGGRQLSVCYGQLHGGNRLIRPAGWLCAWIRFGVIWFGVIHQRLDVLKSISRGKIGARGSAMA